MPGNKRFDIRRLFGRGVANDIVTAVSLVLGIICLIFTYAITGNPFIIISYIVIVGFGVLLASHR